MRVLLEFKGKRVDIKDPISLRQKQEETLAHLTDLIGEALGVIDKVEGK